MRKGQRELESGGKNHRYTVPKPARGQTPSGISSLLNTYNIHDARTISALIPSKNVINVTITSPPYWDLKDYEVEPQIGFGQKYDAYMSDLVKVFKAVHAATKSDGSLWIVSDTVKRNGSLKLVPFDLARELEKIGWNLQDIIIWNKDKTLPWSHQGKLRNIFEYVTFFSKTRRFKFRLKAVRDVDQLREWWIRYPERYSPDGKAPARTWYYPIPRQGSWGKNWVRHFNPLPPPLIERILLMTTAPGDVVLDPFAGSGTVLAQAHVMGRNYIGTDLNPKYQEMFQERVLPAMESLRKSEESTKVSAEKRREFRSAILSLRRTKYPKEALRQYTRVHKDPKLDAIVGIKDSGDGSLEVTFVFQDLTTVPDGFLDQVESLSKKPPLSKYEVAASFSVVTTKAAATGRLGPGPIDPMRRLFAYENGRTYRWSRKIRLSELPDIMQKAEDPANLEGRFPLILSNVGVRIDTKKPLSKDGEA